MKAKLDGRFIQVEKLKKDYFKSGDNVVMRQIYKDEAGNRYIKRKDGSLERVALKTGNNGYHCFWYYEVKN